MKDKLQQIEFLDKKLLPLYGFKSIVDYNHKISLNNIINDEGILEKLNMILPEFKKTFTVKEFNFHKTNNKINTATQAYALLKKCLELLGVMYEICPINKINYLRLVSENLILSNYIENKMSDILDFSKSKVEFSNEIYGKKMEKIDMKDFEKNIIREENEELYLQLPSLISGNQDYIEFNLCEIKTCSLKKLEIEFIPIEVNGHTFISKEDLDKVLSDSFCDILYNYNIPIYRVHEINDKNLLPNNVIFPFGIMNFIKSFSFKISNIKNLDILKKIITIKLKITSVILSDKFTVSFKKNKKYIEIVYDKKRLLFTANDIKYDDSTSSSDLIIDNDDSVLMKDIKGQETIIGKYKCFRLDDKYYDGNKVEYSSEYLKCLSSGYPLVVLYHNYIKMNVLFYKKHNNKYIFSHRIPRMGDLVGNISITLPEKVDNMKLSFVGYSTNLYEKSINYDYDDKDNKKIHLDIGVNTCINLTANAYRCEIKFEIDNIYNIHTLLQNSYLSYDLYYMEQNKRIELKNHNFLNLDN